MGTRFLIKFRTATLGLVALTAAAFMRLLDQPASATRAIQPDPLLAPPPAGSFLLPSADVDAHIMAALERQLHNLNNDIAGLRASLEAMSPLPDQDEFYIPVDPAQLQGEPMFATGVSPLVDLYLTERDRVETARLMAEWTPIQIAA